MIVFRLVDSQFFVENRVEQNCTELKRVIPCVFLRAYKNTATAVYQFAMFFRNRRSKPFPDLTEILNPFLKIPNPDVQSVENRNNPKIQ